MTDASSGELRHRLETVEEAIQKACASVGRHREEITLLAVTKTVDTKRINEAIALGVSHIGENRVQEFLEKNDLLLHSESLDKRIIGHLQTNKVNSIVGKVSMVESVDSIRLAKKLSDASEKAGVVTDVLLEVNIGGEESKTGIALSGLDELLESCAEMNGIHVRGLMTVAPILQTEKEKRAIFSKMYALLVDKRAKNCDNISMDILSMGMSGDFCEAIMEGSTSVRIGSAIFGNRNYT